MSSSHKISAFVVSYNRAAILGTCLRALRFADEVIVVDKSSTDGSLAVATEYADKVFTVPWSPTVEETRVFALSKCSHDWILFLDDDECLSPEASRFIQCEMEAPRADIYALPLRHYVLGEHSEQAYYWPEHHVRCFRRDAVEFRPTVHAGLMLRSDRVMKVSPEAGACIHHLSHPDVASWIERTNRYTSRPDRARVESADEDLTGFAHARIDYWIGRSHDTTPGGYPAAVALLRSVYDMVDRLKTWEETRGLDGAALFHQACERLDAAHRAESASRRGGLAGMVAGLRPAMHDLADGLRRPAKPVRSET
jgi:glycosyltransferase involved in cell wall biosynthesis